MNNAQAERVTARIEFFAICIGFIMAGSLPAVLLYVY